MATIQSLRQALELDFLEPMTERVAAAPISVGFSANPTTIKYSAGVFSPDEESLIGPGAVVEVGTGLYYITAYDGSTRTLTVQAGHQGTPDEAHVAGELMRIPGRFTRHRMEQAIRKAIDGLWEPLWVTKSIRTTTDAAGYLPLPLNAVMATDVLWLDTNDRWTPAPSQLMVNLDENFTAIQLHPNVPAGRIAIVEYGAKIQAPSSSTATIEDLPQKWEYLVIIDAALTLTAGLDVDAVSQEMIVESLRLQQFPVRSGASITTSLIQVSEYLRNRERMALRADQRDTVERREVISYG